MFIRLISALALLLCVIAAKGAPLTGAETPEQFFEIVAGSLLKEELKVDLHHIPVYPTNGYSPEVHRLLQVTANLFDSTTNRGDAYPYFPTCFRPRFGTNENEIFISGYVEESGERGNTFISHPWRNAADPADRPIDPNDNVYGIPVILGAKKGFPNFNEFVVQTVADVTRKLELRKNAPGGRLIATNQAFIIGISNVIAAELWHPWSNDYPRGFAFRLTAQTSFTLTNDHGFSLSNVLLVTTNQALLPGAFRRGQFRIPLIATVAVLSNAVFKSDPVAHFESAFSGGLFESQPAFASNHWGLAATTRLIFYAFDGARLVDYVALSDLNEGFDLTSAVGAPDLDPYAIWDSQPAGNVTFGVRNQISLGAGLLGVSDWSTYSPDPLADKIRGIDSFRVFLGLPPIYYRPVVIPNTNIAMQVPFTPTRKLLHASDWESNDPLLHQCPPNLESNHTSGRVLAVRPTTPLSITNQTSIGTWNRRYSPWAGNPTTDPASDFFALDGRVKDPGILSPDDWLFSEPASLAFATLGQIHRGTPWQTIYLKSDAASQDEWLAWYGDASGHPTSDWRLVSILAPLLQTNSLASLLSVNSSDLQRWAQVLDDLTVASSGSNCAVSELTLGSDPNGLAQLIDGIERTRSASARGYFDDLGGILATPELSFNSPWLKRFDRDWNFCVADSMLEIVPAQLLSRLRPDPVASAARQNSEVALRFHVFPGRDYEVLKSQDLNTWTAASTNSVPDNVFELLVSPSSEATFYKLRLVE